MSRMAMMALIPLGLMRTYRDPQTGELIVDDNSGPRVAGDHYGLSEEEQRDYSGREERAERKLGRMERREERHDDRVEHREERHDERYERKHDRVERKAGHDDDDRGSKNKVKQKEWYEQNPDWQADARGGAASSITAADQTHTITLKVGAKAFKAFDMSFSGSTDTDAVVTRIEFGEDPVFSSPDGVSISLWNADSTLRNFLANTKEITGGLEITVTFISGSGSAEAPKRIRAALMGFKLISRRCD